jgi:uncharacterized membrane protein
LTHSSTAPTTTAIPTLLRIVATLSVVFIVLQGLSAGGILSRVRVAESLHFGGAIVVHVFTGLTVVAAFLLVRHGQGPRWPTALAAVVFVVGFVQATVGEAGLLLVHVPLAMLLLAGAVVVMGWSFAGARR